MVFWKSETKVLVDCTSPLLLILEHLFIPHTAARDDDAQTTDGDAPVSRGQSAHTFPRERRLRRGLMVVTHFFKVGQRPRLEREPVLLLPAAILFFEYEPVSVVREAIAP